MTEISRLPSLNRELAGRAADLEQPERAIQFGTGAFLRGFVEFFLDEANRQGLFGGRVVMVGSTPSGRDELFAQQDGLYTLIARGVERGTARTEERVVGVVSRALSAATQWEAVLECARSAALEVVFSNTTETGITYDAQDLPDPGPPRSFPGKLTRFLYERARSFDYDPARGVVVIPCELIENNGTRLRDIVLRLAARWNYDPEFGAWMRRAVTFCNTLVDRIVAGTPARGPLEHEWQRLGYRDELLTVTELYRLFAIEGDDTLRSRLPFLAADPGILVVGDVRPYRERKVRLLNGAHSAMVAAALLSGCETVGEALEHEQVGRFVRRIVLEEILPTVDAPDAGPFAHTVLDRFANPFIRHALFDITLQCAAKLRVRVVPSIIEHTRGLGRAPSGLALGFAAYILFMRGELQSQRRQAGLHVPADDADAQLREHWRRLGEPTDFSLASMVIAICADAALWGTDLTQLPGFAEMVFEHLSCACRYGMSAALEAYLTAHAGGVS